MTPAELAEILQRHGAEPGDRRGESQGRILALTILTPDTVRGALAPVCRIDVTTRTSEVGARPMTNAEKPRQREGVLRILVTRGPLCHFSAAVPDAWPAGHRWVGLGDREKATCPECRREAGLQDTKEETSR
jgi:hypothetical protein